MRWWSAVFQGQIHGTAGINLQRPQPQKKKKNLQRPEFRKRTDGGKPHCRSHAIKHKDFQAKGDGKPNWQSRLQIGKENLSLMRAPCLRWTLRKCISPCLCTSTFIQNSPVAQIITGTTISESVKRRGEKKGDGGQIELQIDLEMKAREILFRSILWKFNCSVRRKERERRSN